MNVGNVQKPYLCLDSLLDMGEFILVRNTLSVGTMEGPLDFCMILLNIGLCWCETIYMKGISLFMAQSLINVGGFILIGNTLRNVGRLL